MKTINLTDEQYNNLASLISKEALDILNNNSNVDNKNLNNKILIRILSKEEYEKYIFNSTLNGSILAGNNEVFHYQYTGKIKGVFYAFFQLSRKSNAKQQGGVCNNNNYIVKFPFDSKIALSHVNQQVLVCNPEIGGTRYQVDYGRYGYISDYNVISDIIIYTSLLQNNTLLQNSVGGDNTYDFEFVYGVGGADENTKLNLSGFYYKLTDKEVIILTNKTNENSVLAKRYNFYIEPYYSYSHYPLNYNYDIRYMPSFRPVFNFKDNNKSDNIFR